MVELEELASDDDDGPPELERIDGEDEEEDRDVDEEFVCDKVHDRLYLGSAKACDPQVLFARGITHVFAVGKGLPPCLSAADGGVARTVTPTCAQEELQYVYLKQGIEYMCLEVEDAQDTSLLNYTFGANKFLRDALANPESRVVVLCEEGTTLGPTMLATFLICEFKMKMAVALGKITTVQPAVDLNRGYQRHLRFLERADGELPEWVLPP